jgi:hypothetical protein
MEQRRDGCRRSGEVGKEKEENVMGRKERMWRERRGYGEGDSIREEDDSDCGRGK